MTQPLLKLYIASNEGQVKCLLLLYKRLIQPYLGCNRQRIQILLAINLAINLSTTIIIADFIAIIIIDRFMVSTLTFT